MKPPPNLAALKKRVDRYLWESRDPKAVAFKNFYREHLRQFSRTAIIGGLVRDFAINGRYGFKSDIDIVIDDDNYAVSKFAQEIGASGNKYGGFSVRNNCVKIDFWSLSSTWTAKNANIPVNSIEDVINATFFDWDSIVYLIEEKKIICTENYIKKITEKEIDIVVEKTPSKNGNLRRAINRILKWNLTPGPSLEIFIRNNTTKEIALEAIKKFNLPESQWKNTNIDAFVDYLVQKKDKNHDEFYFYFSSGKK
ncbi:hypothetical protein [Komagataeibacter xylinus]|uniref:hypothetical protein n=1 Tax=Komagataeibacter xylinus TaxID=28448 RepID=UPI001030CA8F|nr:hypothetical protein [Komagataeibacter xylinus]